MMNSPFKVYPVQFSIHPQCTDLHIPFSCNETEMNNGDNSPYMAHPLVVSTHVSLQSPLCGLLYIFVSLGMILVVSGHN